MAKPHQDSVAPRTFATHMVEMAGVCLVADKSGALYWPSRRALLVADLHLEKGSSFVPRGLRLPPYDTRQTLAKLAAAISAYAPDLVIALGDSFHDRGADARMCNDDLAALGALQSNRRWIWVRGNHDPVIGAPMGGDVVDQLEWDGITLRHAPGDQHETPEIAGHLHPAARLAVNGTSLRSRCFVGDRGRLILPAFGAFTGGLNILDEAFAPLFASEALAVLMLGSDGVYPVAPRNLLPD